MSFLRDFVEETRAIIRGHKIRSHPLHKIRREREEEREKKDEEKRGGDPQED